MSLSLTYLKDPSQYSCCPTAYVLFTLFDLIVRNCDYMFFFETGDSPDFSCPKCGSRYCLDCKVLDLSVILLSFVRLTITRHTLARNISNGAWKMAKLIKSSKTLYPEVTSRDAPVVRNGWKRILAAVPPSL